MTAPAASQIKVTLSAEDTASKRVAVLEKQLGLLQSRTERTGHSMRAMVDTRGLTHVAEVFGGMSRESRTIARSLSGLMPVLGSLSGIGAVGAIAGLDRMAANWAVNTSRMGQQASMLNIPIQHLDALGGAADAAGSSHEAMEGSLQTLRRGMFDARYGLNPTMSNLMRLLHIDPAEGVESANRKIIAAAHDQQDVMKRLVILRAAYNENAEAMLPIAAKGVAAFDDLTRAAERHGVQTHLDVERAGELHRSWVGLGDSSDHLKNSLMTSLSPALTFLNDELSAGIDRVKTGIDAWAQTDGPEKLRDKIKNAGGEIEQYASAHPALASLLGITAATLGPKLASNGLKLGLRAAPVITAEMLALDGANYMAGDVPVDPTVRARSNHFPGQQYLYDNNSSIRKGGNWAFNRFERNPLIRQLMGLGWTEEGAIGGVANAEAESSLRPDARNGSHAGLFQWDQSRQDRIKQHFGKSVLDMNRGEQIAAFDWEIRNHYPQAFEEANSAQRGGIAAGYISRDFEVPNPDDPLPEMKKRGALAERIAQQFRNSGDAPYGPVTPNEQEEPIFLHPAAQAGGAVKVDVTIHNEGMPPNMRVSAQAQAIGNIALSDSPKVIRSGIARGN